VGDVLSQSEIDSLLAALSSGELDADDMQDNGEKQVKNYDFNRPAKFSKSTCVLLKLFLNITEDWFPLTCRSIYVRIYRYPYPVRRPLPFRNSAMHYPILLSWES